MRKHANKTELLTVATAVIAMLAVLVAPVAAGWEPASVLWVGPRSLSWNDGSATVTKIGISQFATKNLDGFDVIYVDTSAIQFTGLSILLDRAADVSAFVNAGGGLITDNGGRGQFPNFSWVPNAGSLGWVAQGQDSVFLTLLGTTHPVTAGTTNDGLSGWVNSQHNYFSATAGMDVLATNPSGQPNVLAGAFGLGRLVYFGLNPTIHQPAGDTQQLIRQAVAWAWAPPDQPLVCDAGGPYEVECTGTATSIKLDGFGHSNPNDPPGFSWSTDCSGGTFDDNTLVSPTLTIDTPSTCSLLTCNVFLTVDDGTDSDSCQTAVTVDDTTPPPITCPVDTTIDEDQSTDPANTGTATATLPGGEKMYWIDFGTKKIQRADLDGSNIEDLVTTGLSSPYGVALDGAAAKIYWTDSGTDKIHRADLDGSNVEELVTGLSDSRGIALDVAAEKMYWVDVSASKIRRADLDGSNVEELVIGLFGPRGIALDIAAGKMYWTDSGADKIQRADLDGSNVEDLISIGLVSPLGIALDVVAEKMYWIDVSTDKIQRANLDGSHVEDLVTIGLSNPQEIALDVAAGKMYWTDMTTDKIQRADLDGANIEDLVVGLVAPLGLALQLHPAECDLAADVSFTDIVVEGLCPQETVITRTWTATDDCGNNGTCDQIITVVDTSLPPVCDAGGPYLAECGGTTTSINLDGGACIDASDLPSFFWSTDCLGGIFDDNTLESPTLTVDGVVPCDPLTCNVFLTVDDGTDAASCQTTVAVTDTIPPPPTLCPDDTTIECYQSTDPASTGTASITGFASATKMYWTDFGSDKIQRADPDGANVEDLITTGLLFPSGIALDVAAGKMYWIDAGPGTIHRADLDGSNVEDLVVSIPDSIALDVTAGKMYWTNGELQKIQRADLDGANVVDLITGLGNPNGISLDVAAGKMYWSSDNKIQRANLNGSNLEDLVTTGLSGPFAIALDVAEGKMYWTDPNANKIQRADLDGANVEDLVTGGLSSPRGISLDVVAGKMYWVDTGTDKIQRADLNGADVEDLITGGLIGPWGIALQLDAVECDPDPDLSFTDSVEAGSCPQESVITRTWTATDDCGNSSSTCNQIIEVVDTIAPTIDNCPVANMVVECDGAGNTAQLSAWLNSFAASDACGDVTLSDDFSGLSDDCGETGTATVLFTATDECGNQNSCTPTFTIVDTSQPTIDNCPTANMVVECDGAGNTAQLNDWLNSFAASDTCGDVMLSDDFAGLSDACGETGTATVLFTATDECGNQNSCTSTFTIVDTSQPTIDNCPAANMIVECDGAGNQAELNAWLNSLSASDVCSEVTLTDDFSGLSDGCGETGTATVVFTATDDCALQNSCTATFTIVDTTDPVIDNCPAADMVVECDGAGNTTELDNWLNSFAASDTCGEVTLGNDFAGLSEDCGETGTATVTFTATDDCGNPNSCTATFMIEDTIQPAIDNCPTADMVVECDGAGNQAELDVWLNSFAASDVCGDVTLSDDFAGLSDGCGETGTATVVFTATDDCGLENSCTATFTIEDTITPAISCPDDNSITSGDSTAPPATGEAGGSDGCDNADPDIIFADELIIPDCLSDPIHFVIEREWTATDDCGLSSSCVQTITVLRKDVSLIIKQGACPAPVNPNSNGVVPMLVSGDTDFDVDDVLLSTLRLTRCDCSGGDLAPIDGPPGPKIQILDLNHPFDGDVDCVQGPCACNADQSSDGIDDIWMKFRTDEMMAGLPLAAGEGVVILSVTGELDAPAYPAASLNAAFIASDCIIVVPPGGQGAISAMVESNVLDTFIELTPLDLNVDSDGFANFSRAYFPGTVMSVTAPPTSAARPFVRWRVDGVLQELGVRFLELVISEDTTLHAIYQRQTRLEPERPEEDDGDLE